MNIPAIEALASLAVSKPDEGSFITSNTPVNASGFLDSLRQMDQQVSSAESALQAFALGEMTSTHELMIAMEQAKFSMQVAVEVRNRAVDAYQELLRMQI